ncbi:MAG: single-stranded DNA-binding protein [Thermoleophilia bacterium]|nr:single-stranded DNA-binding protein [Thermoleophilia bacterium]
MPADLNRVTLVGRLTRDPEMRHLPSGDPVMSIRLGVTSRQREGDQWTDRPNYFDVTLFGRRGEALQSYISRGSRIGVDGRLSWREWTTQDGQKRQSVEIIANDIFLLDGRGDSGGGGGDRGGWTERPAPTPAGGDLPVDTTDYRPPAPAADDDIPF